MTDAGPEPGDGIVLVVDDDDEVRETLCELLELHGHHAVGAADGIEALAVLRSGEKVSFMVLDLGMPHMNGLEVLKVMAGDIQLRDLPLCMSTVSVERVPLGVPLLPKPVDMDRLLRMIEESRAN